MTDLHQNETGSPNVVPGRDAVGRPLSTADLAAAAQRESQHDAQRESEREASRRAARAAEREQQIGDDDATGTFEAMSPSRQGPSAAGSPTGGDANTSAGEQSRHSEATGRTDTSGRRVEAGTGRTDSTTGREAEAARGAGNRKREPQRGAGAQAASHGSGASSRADGDNETLEPLFTPDRTETYRSRWLSIQSSFVDDPRQAVRSGDELVAQVMANLANTFAEERHRAEAQLDETGEGSTEDLRVALRRYRAFFDRLLSL